MLRLLLFRIGLVLLPLAAWIIWAEIARRRGKPMGSTPWAWLIVAGVALMVASLAVTAVLDPQSPSEKYVPKELD